MAIEERAYGPDHPEVARTLTNLGSARRRLGQPAQARELFERALAILHAQFPTGHPLTDSVARNLHVVAPGLVVLRDGRVARRPGEAMTDT